MTRRAPAKGSRKGVGGRPSKYNAELFPAQALVACAEMGADNVKLAKLFGVSVSSVRTCCWSFPTSCSPPSVWS